MDWRLQKQQGIESSFAIKSLFELLMFRFQRLPVSTF
jgi:hypothetical protein